MHIVELLLPVRDNAGAAFARVHFDDVRRELTRRFGGVTAFVRAPAEGLWKEEDGAVVRDDIVLFEVMIDELDRQWWGDYRRKLCSRFAQDEIVIRATVIERL